jgi:phosphatidylserine/phosphatidylglycerophosphate/cardiolipin synthase-like enzyme
MRDVATDMDRPSPPLLFGGPDQPYGVLRDRLQALVDASPPGSSISWATYYFRDVALASALMRAADRGVSVRLVMEPRPRLTEANDRVVALLREHGLAGGFSVRKRVGGLGQLHSKAYVFTHPRLALIGSFNPSSNGSPEDKAFGEIGDQDRGYNLLLCLEDPEMVSAVEHHISFLGLTRAGPLDRFRPRLNSSCRVGEDELFFYPRIRTRLVETDIGTLGLGDRVRAAISHMKKGALISALEHARRRGAAVDLLVHATERRVPAKLVAQLVKSGIAVTRIGDCEAVPMHNKFVVIERRGLEHAWLGSYNYNSKSRWLNDEILIRTARADVVAQLKRRFDAMKSAET